MRAMSLMLRLMDGAAEMACSLIVEPEPVRPGSNSGSRSAAITTSLRLRVDVRSWMLTVVASPTSTKMLRRVSASNPTYVVMTE